MQTSETILVVAVALVKGYSFFKDLVDRWTTFLYNFNYLQLIE